MVTLTADVTKEIKKMTEELVQKEMYKSQGEIVRDAIRQLALKYGRSGVDIEKIRNKIAEAGKKSGKTLSQTVVEMRDEA